MPEDAPCTTLGILFIISVNQVKVKTKCRYSFAENCCIFGRNFLSNRACRSKSVHGGALAGAVAATSAPSSRPMPSAASGKEQANDNSENFDAARMLISARRGKNFDSLH